MTNAPTDAVNKMSIAPENNPILEHAECQGETRSSIERALLSGIGKPVYQYGTSEYAGVIIPEGLEDEKLHDMALVYCKDGSLAEIQVDYFTNVFINPDSMDQVVLPPVGLPQGASLARNVAYLIDAAGKSMDQQGGCWLRGDIDKEPERMLELLRSTIERKQAEIVQTLENRQEHTAQANKILNTL